MLPSDESRAVTPIARALSPVNTSSATCTDLALSFARAPLPRALRGLVSKKKRRFIDAAVGVDLDLSYITDRVIATGYPAVGVEALYRNPASALRAFLTARHGASATRVWNLCRERGYPNSVLGENIRVDHELTWYDHCPPPFAFLRPLCEGIALWLQEAPSRIVCIRE